MGTTERQVSSVAGATMASRMLGLLRDVLLFAGLGAGPYLSAFVVAFTLPNLLRRMLGEGALSSAVIPVFAQRLEAGGREDSFRILNRVLSRLIVGLLALTLVGGAILMLAAYLPGLSLRWALAGKLSALLLPYGLFICAAAMIAAQLNTLHRFLVPALSPIWLNLVMIGALLLGLWGWENDVGARVLLLSLGVLGGGLMQAAVPGFALMREGWRPRLDAQGGDSLREIWRLLLPGLVGAAVVQVNLLLSRLLALAIDDSAASILYLANRLVEVPYGVFVVALTTVSFPLMARAVARGDAEGFRRGYESGRGAIWLITLPAAVGLIYLARPIVELLQWGNFASADAARTVLPLQLLSLALPFFSWTMLATRALHSWKEMRLPVRFGIVNAGLNLVLGLALMGPLREVGLALANLIAAVVLTVLLEMALIRRGAVSLGSRALLGLGRMALASAAMALALWGWSIAVGVLQLDGKLQALALVGGGVPLGASVYFAACALLRIPELAFLGRMLPARFRPVA